MERQLRGIALTLLAIFLVVLSLWIQVAGGIWIPFFNDLISSVGADVIFARLLRTLSDILPSAAVVLAVIGLRMVFYREKKVEEETP